MNVLLQNYDGKVLNEISYNRALKYLYLKKVEVVKETIVVITDTVQKVVPSIVRLLYYVNTQIIEHRRRKQRIRFCRKDVFARDKYQCRYCGKRKNVVLTIDHVVPKSRKGRTDMANCVTACLECNLRKGDRTPAEAGMTLRGI